MSDAYEGASVAAFYNKVGAASTGKSVGLSFARIFAAVATETVARSAGVDQTAVVDRNLAAVISVGRDAEPVGDVGASPVSQLACEVYARVASLDKPEDAV